MRRHLAIFSYLLFTILREISPGCSLEGLMLKLKLHYFGHLMWRVDSFRLWCWEGLGAGGEGDDRGWDPGWHHRLDGREFEWTPGVGDGQGGLACCNSWGCRVGHDWTTELKWTDCEQCFYVPPCTNISLNICFQSLWVLHLEVELLSEMITSMSNFV